MGLKQINRSMYTSGGIKIIIKKKGLIGISCIATSGTESYFIPMIAVYKTGYQFGV